MEFNDRDREKVIELVGNLMRFGEFRLEFKESNTPKGLHILCELSPREMDDLLELAN